MPAGNQPDAGQLHAMLANNAAGLRSTCDAISRLWAYVGPLGTGGLATPPPDGPGMRPEDVEDFYAAVSEMFTVASVYFGTAAQPEARDHDSALAPVRGGS